MSNVPSGGRPAAQSSIGAACSHAVLSPQTRRKMVFVGGLHRSGTTHLAQLLGQHPDASLMTQTGVVMDEGQYLQDIYPQDWQMGGPGCFAFSPQAHQTEALSAGRTEEYRERLLQHWTPFWNTDQPVLIEKTPGNLLSARFLQSLFGTDAYFVFITRHPVAVSLATRKWSRTSLFALADHWLAAHDVMRHDLPFLHNAICVSYERLVADPAATLNEILAFIGLPPMSHLAPATPALATENFNAGYFATWTTHYLTAVQPTVPQRVQAGEPVRETWGRRLFWLLRGKARRFVLLRRGLDILSTPQEARAILARHEKRIREFGYSLVDLTLKPDNFATLHKTSHGVDNPQTDFARARG